MRARDLNGMNFIYRPCTVRKRVNFVVPLELAALQVDAGDARCARFNARSCVRRNVR